MTIVKFGDVAQKVLGNEDRLSTTREYYIGGEHFATGNLEIKQFGRIRDEDLGYQFHFPFESGDVLFMTKNPRLKKAGRVNISGICSIATFVIRTKSESRLLQDFLPILMQSDSFWEYLMANQSGSVNPFIKWGTLEKYCFDLPDISTQKQYCTIIWNLQELINELETQTALLDQLVKSRFTEMFGTPTGNEKQWPTETMKSVAPAIQSNNKPRSEGNWLLNLDAIQSNSGEVLFKNRVPKSEVNGSIMAFSPDHVLYSKLRPYLNKVAVPDEYGFGTTELIPLLPDRTKLTRTYLAHLLRSDAFVSKFSSAVAGTKMPRVTMDVFWKFNIPLPPISLQEKFASFVEQVDKSKFELQKHLDDTKRLQKALINQAFDPKSVQN